MTYNQHDYREWYVYSNYTAFDIMKKQYQFRLEDEDAKIFEEILEEDERNPSEMTRIIMKRYLRFRRTKTQRGDVTISKALLRSRHEGIKKTEITTIAEKDARYVISEMKKQESNLTFNELVKRIKEWNKESKIRLVIEPIGNNTAFSQLHDLGGKWSEIQCKMYCKMFEIIGCTVITKEWSENTFNFEVSRPE